MNIVLVVNNNPRNLILATTQLLLLNYQVATASVHDDGISLARILKPDLMVIDTVDGDLHLDTIRIMRQDPELNQIPLVIVSAVGTVDDRERAIEAGCHDYIIKPYDVNTFREVVRRYMPPPVTA